MITNCSHNSRKQIFCKLRDYRFIEKSGSGQSHTRVDDKLFYQNLLRSRTFSHHVALSNVIVGENASVQTEFETIRNGFQHFECEAEGALRLLFNDLN